GLSNHRLRRIGLAVPVGRPRHAMRVIADHPPPEMYRLAGEIDCQCARCGSSCDYQDCWNCDEDGFSDHDCGEDTCCCLHPEPNVVCHVCGGHAGWQRCISSPEWCQANPLPGREHVPRGSIEWFTIEGGDRV